VTDLLADYRRGGTVPELDATPQKASERQTGGYRAFGVASGQARPLRLDIRATEGLSVARAYSSLLEIAYDRHDYSGILLLFPQKIVTIKGRNLRPVVDALLAQTCEYLQQIGQGERAATDAPVIDDIQTAGAPAGKPTPKAGG
jgi:hypothetical protein